MPKQNRFVFTTLILMLMAMPAVAQVVVATVPIGMGAEHAVTNPVTNKTYVLDCGTDSSCQSRREVTVIDGATLSIQTVTVGYYSYALAVNTTTNKIYVGNSCGDDPTCTGNGTVTVIDGATLSTQTVALSDRGGLPVVDEITNKIYVTCNQSVTQIDGTTLSTRVVADAAGPLAVAVNPVTNKIYVTNGDHTATIIDGVTLSTQSVAVGNAPVFVAVDTATNKAYVANLCGNNSHCSLVSGTVTVIDGATLATETVAVGFSPYVLAVNSITHKIYVANFCGSDEFCDSNGTVTVIDGATLSTQNVDVGFGPVDVRVNPVTNEVYLANQNGSCTNCNNGTVTVIDGATLAVTPVAVGGAPQAVAINSATNRVYVPNLADNTTSVIAGNTGLQFVAVTPCRAVDTRPAYGGSGPIGGGNSQDFSLTQSGACSLPTNAAAYSLNVTVVPSGALAYLTIWPASEARPDISLMNSPDGRIKANAAIVPAGVNANVSVYVTDTTNVLIDVDGYFLAASDSTLAFYHVDPCRVVDTRKADGDLAGPFLSGGQERDFPILESSCIPAGVTPQAYSFSVTAVPHPTGQELGYLTVWPKGASKPVVSTLNNFTGTIVANAAIVPSGTGGSIAVFPDANTDLVIDINGYFAAPGQGGLSLYPTVPCRVIDTRNGNGAFIGLLTPPVDVEHSTCAPGSTAQAFVLNATVVPTGSLGYLTLWPDGLGQPLVSTLNAIDGVTTSNMAIVPTINGAVDAYASGLTQLILDISSYFAP